MLREILKLNSEIWKDLPDELLEMAFRPSKIKLDSKYEAYLKSKYTGMYNLENLEYLGDAVLELVATLLVFNESEGDPGYMTIKREELVRNTVLYCLANKADLCNYIEKTLTYSLKTCADVFEAIIGALTYYLLYIKERQDYIDIIYKYLLEVFYTKSVIDTVFDETGIIDSCLVGPMLTANKAGKNFIVRKNTLISQVKSMEKPTSVKLSDKTRAKIKRTLINHQWIKDGLYYQDWQKTKESFPILEKLYKQFDIDKFVVKLHDPKDESGTFAVTIYKIDFDNGTMEPYYTGEAKTEREALNIAAEKALVDIFKRFRVL